ncbi:MAG: L-threonylcarbamoyladenylate synthase [Acidimicrobiales bacterium]
MTSEQREEISVAAAAVAAGEIVGIPTDTVYGIAADPTNRAAIELLFAAKARPVSIGLPVLVGDPAEAGSLAELDDRAARLIELYWPGPLTIVLARRRREDGSALYLGGDDSSVGLRCPAHDVARELLVATGPLAVTSANPHGELPARTAGELRARLGGRGGPSNSGAPRAGARAVMVVVDGGTCDGTPSSVVSLLGATPRVLREGAIATGELLEALGLRASGDE